MAKIKRSTAKIKQGITGVVSGSEAILEFTRKGVLKGLSEPIKIKRPNQYRNS